MGLPPFAGHGIPLPMRPIYQRLQTLEPGRGERSWPSETSHTAIASSRATILTAPRGFMVRSTSGQFLEKNFRRIYTGVQ
jgi:hypothetical protein